MHRQRLEGAREASSLRSEQGCPFPWPPGKPGVTRVELGGTTQYLRCYWQVGGTGDSSRNGQPPSAAQCWLWVEVGEEAACSAAGGFAPAQAWVAEAL